MRVADFGSTIVQRSQVLLHIYGSLLPYMPKEKCMEKVEKDGEPKNKEPPSSDLACKMVDPLVPAWADLALKKYLFPSFKLTSSHWQMTRVWPFVAAV